MTKHRNTSSKEAGLGASVDDYLAAQPGTARNILAQVRAIIRKAVPRAEESISYQIPTYKMSGTSVIYFAGWKQHYSLYPASAPLVNALKTELAPYEVSKGTIRFPLAAPVPARLIARIVKLRAQEAAASSKTKMKTKAPAKKKSGSR